VDVGTFIVGGDLVVGVNVTCLVVVGGLVLTDLVVWIRTVVVVVDLVVAGDSVEGFLVMVHMFVGGLALVDCVVLVLVVGLTVLDLYRDLEGCLYLLQD